MKNMLFLIALAAPGWAAEDPAGIMFDTKLPQAQRDSACVKLQSQPNAENIGVMTRALEDESMRTCAVVSLRMYGAVDALTKALSNPDPQIRAAALREAGSFQRPELLEALGKAALDPNLLVASNAMQGLTQYGDPAVIPVLAEIARAGGMTGDMALDRILSLDPAAALPIARKLIQSPQVPDRLFAMRVLGAAGDSSDLPVLQNIAAQDKENLSQKGRGFGLMPAISLSRAAQTAIAGIQARTTKKG